ncbi:MAG: hypothetical protein KAY24_01845 [Candidatus Eisenbacteria sp.]|nr:hypothetical protein [Candidatus Eisenbacteria bacterium]
MARRAAFVDTLRKNEAPILLVDGGDFFHRVNKLESIVSWREMERLGYAAVTLGEVEFERWELAESLLTHTDLPVVCTNVERQTASGWELVGNRYLIVPVNGVRVGILSVIDSQLSNSVIEKAGDRVRLLPAMETTREVARILRKKSDVVVLLAHLDYKAMEQYASSLPEVDVILGGHMTRKDTGPKKIADTIINRSGTRGQHVCITRLVVSPQNEVVDFGGLNLTLTADYPEDPVVAELAQTAKDESIRLRRAEASKKLQIKKQKREELEKRQREGKKPERR